MLLTGKIVYTTSFTLPLLVFGWMALVIDGKTTFMIPSNTKQTLVFVLPSSDNNEKDDTSKPAVTFQSRNSPTRPRYSTRNRARPNNNNNEDLLPAEEDDGVDISTIGVNVVSSRQGENGMLPSASQFFGIANVYGSSGFNCPVCQNCTDCDSSCPTPLAPADITMCGTGATSIISASPSGTIRFTTTSASTCTYGIVATPPNNRIQVTCANMSGNFVKNSITNPGGSTLNAGSTPQTTTGNVAILHFVTSVADSSSYSINCTWQAIP